MSEQVEQRERMTINEIASLTNRNAKSLRAYLRTNFTRSEEQKNARWGDAKSAELTKSQTTALVKNFTRAVETEESEVS